MIKIRTQLVVYFSSIGGIFIPMPAWRLLPAAMQVPGGNALWTLICQFLYFSLGQCPRGLSRPAVLMAFLLTFWPSVLSRHTLR